MSRTVITTSTFFMNLSAGSFLIIRNLSVSAYGRWLGWVIFGEKQFSANKTENESNSKNGKGEKVFGQKVVVHRPREQSRI